MITYSPAGKEITNTHAKRESERDRKRERERDDQRK
jgi:hypothetical protein